MIPRTRISVWYECDIKCKENDLLQDFVNHETEYSFISSHPLSCHSVSMVIRGKAAIFVSNQP